MSNWFQWRDYEPGRYVRSCSVNFNQWAGWNFDGDRLFRRRQRQHALDVHEQLAASAAGVNVNAAPASTTASPAAGPACSATRARPLVLRATATTGGAVVSATTATTRRDGQGTTRAQRVEPDAEPGGRRRAMRFTAGVRFRPELTTTAQWVENEIDANGATHYVFGRLEPDDRRDDAAGELHDDADAVAAALRPAVRLGRRLHAISSELVDGRAADYEDRYRPTPTPTTPTSTSARSGRPTCCAGNTGRARRSSSCGSRGARSRQRLRQLQLRAATSTACSRRRHATRFW